MDKQDGNSDSALSILAAGSQTSGAVEMRTFIRGGDWNGNDTH